MKNSIFYAFWDNTISNGKSFLTSNIDVKISRAIISVKFFYFLIFFLSLQSYSPFSQFPEWHTLLESERFFKPIWSVAWLKYTEWNVSVKCILIFFFISSIANLLLWQKSRMARVLLFVSMFLYHSLISSFGSIEHWMHLMTIVTFLLIFLPNISNKNTRNESKRFLSVFLGVQAFILITYFTSGYFKFRGILAQEFYNKISVLDSSSLGLFSAMNSYHHNKEYFLTSFVLEHESSIFSLILLIGMCVEFFSIYMLFRPKYHSIIGLLLILLHSGILIIIGPDFSIQILVVGIFILFSPFGNEISSYSLQKSTIDAFKALFSRKSPRENIIIFYEGNCITCNRYLHYISKFNLPENTKISSQDNNLFLSFKEKYPDLKQLGTIVIVENHGTKKQRIRLKADAITWYLSRINIKFKLLRSCYHILPFPSNLLYDIIALNRKKADLVECLLPPISLRKIILN